MTGTKWVSFVIPAKAGIQGSCLRVTSESLNLGRSHLGGASSYCPNSHRSVAHRRWCSSCFMTNRGRLNQHFRFDIGSVGGGN